MKLIDKLESNSDLKKPFIFRNERSICLQDIILQNTSHLKDIKKGDVVAIIGDFDPVSISNLIKLIDLGAIIVPLTLDTKPLHKYFFDSSYCDYILEKNNLRKIDKGLKKHVLIDQLKDSGNPGLILFSTGTTGRPKAILHDFSNFLERYKSKRPPLKTLNFLLFDHIGGINTLFHTIMNNGEVFVPNERSPIGIANEISKNSIELLPTSPSFLRMMLIEKVFDTNLLDSLKLITYGTEKMDENTLSMIASKVDCDLRQTYGMSELGIFKVLTKSKYELWIKIIGSEIDTKIDEGVLKIKSDIRMLGYLNAESPFDKNGWYDTGINIEAGITHTFNPPTDNMSIRGIETSEMLDPTDPTEFVSGLIFETNGTVVMTMTPVTQNITCGVSDDLTELMIWTSSNVYVVGYDFIPAYYEVNCSTNGEDYILEVYLQDSSGMSVAFNSWNWTETDGYESHHSCTTLCPKEDVCVSSVSHHQRPGMI